MLPFPNIAKLRISWEKAILIIQATTRNHTENMQCTSCVRQSQWWLEIVHVMPVITVSTHTLVVFLHHALPLMFSCDHVSADHLPIDLKKVNDMRQWFQTQKHFWKPFGRWTKSGHYMQHFSNLTQRNLGIYIKATRFSIPKFVCVSAYTMPFLPSCDH